jgi:5'(3')-deoxyribonucleotidase
MRKSIGLDLDTCLNNLEHQWLSDYNRDYNDNLTPEDLLTWDTWKYVKPECGKKIYDYLKKPGYFKNLSPQPYAQETVKWLSQYFDLYIVTAYHASTCQDKTDFILANYPEINERNIIFLNNKGLIMLDYLVDDGPHNVEVFKGKSILMDMAYNKFLGNKYIRCHDFRDVKKYFEEVLEQDRRTMQ